MGPLLCDYFEIIDIDSRLIGQFAHAIDLSTMSDNIEALKIELIHFVKSQKQYFTRLIEPTKHVLTISQSLNGYYTVIIEQN